MLSHCTCYVLIPDKCLIVCQAEAAESTDPDPTDAVDIMNDADAEPQDDNQAPTRKSRKTAAVFDSDEEADEEIEANEPHEEEPNNDADTQAQESDSTARQDINMAEAFGSDDEDFDI